VFLRKTLAATAAGLVLLAALALAPAAPVAAQEVVQDEGAAYRAWHDASQAGDNAKAMTAAKEYLEKYPTGQYADFIKKWFRLRVRSPSGHPQQTPSSSAANSDVTENLRVYQPRSPSARTGTTPPNYNHAADAVEFARRPLP
jgi:hypothetical protein